jgi:hypothetical protein
MKLYLVMQYHRGEENPWDVQGVFSTEERAIAACHTSKFIYRELVLDEEQPLEQGYEDVWVAPTSGYTRIHGSWVPSLVPAS